MIDPEMLPKEGAGREELEKFYTWTFDEAWAAHEAWEAENDSNHSKFAVGPFHRWIAAQELKELYEVFKKQGNKRAIIEGLYICSFRDLPIPEWCALAFLETYREITHYRAEKNSWDSVFGLPFPKGTHLYPKRQQRENDFRVYAEVKWRSSEGEPIDGYMFESVGKKFCIGGKT